MSKELTVCEERIFRELHAEVNLKLCNFLYYKFGDLEKSRDFAQEAFLRLWDNCQKVLLTKAKSYLYTVASRLFLDDLAHQKVKLKFQYRSTNKEANYESNPEFLYRQEEFKERLENALSTLNENQRTIFLMSRIDKMKNKEIAATLEISIKTVEKHVANSLKLLKNNLDELKNTKI